jgi:hypothetical protein
VQDADVSDKLSEFIQNSSLFHPAFIALCCYSIALQVSGFAKLKGKEVKPCQPPRRRCCNGNREPKGMGSPSSQLAMKEHKASIKSRPDSRGGLLGRINNVRRNK